MKTNAILRIILFSLTILILTGILLTGLAENRGTVPESEDVVYDSGAAPTPVNATVAATATLYSAPHPEADITGTLEPGDSVTILRQENVTGIQWALTQEGWVLMECLETDAATNVQIPSLGGSGVSVDFTGLRKINIEWVSGNIYIAAVEGIDQIHISESTVENDKDLMNVDHKEDKLTIQFTNETHRFIGINKINTLSKDLRVSIPADWVCPELQLEVASASVTLENMTIGQVDFDGASGICSFVNCTVKDLDIDTASGDVSFFGSLTRLDFDAASASFTGNLTNCPSVIDMDGMSGDLNLTLPADCGFTVTMEGLSSHFNSDFNYSERRSRTYVHGDGRCRVDVDGLSTDVFIHKAVSDIPDASTLPTHHQHTEDCISQSNTCPDIKEHHPEH